MDNEDRVMTRRACLHLLKRGAGATAALAATGAPLVKLALQPEDAAAQGSGQVVFDAFLPAGGPAAYFDVTLYWLGPNGLAPLRWGKTNGNGHGVFYQVPYYRYLNVAVQSPSGVWKGASGNFWYPGEASYVRIGVRHI